MRFSNNTTFCTIAHADSSRAAKDERGLKTWTSNRLSTLSIVTATTLFVCSFSFSNTETLAQTGASNARTNSSKVQSPEEATGTSLRDFNAIQALSPDFIDNPDGGAVPISEDDLWLPDLALGKKSSSQPQGVRVISYGEDKTTTEVRNYTSARQSAAVASNSQTSKVSNAGGSVQQPKAAPSNKSASAANYVSASNRPAAANIRQTQALEPSGGVGGGFSDYSFGDYSTPEAGSVDVDSDMPLQTTSVPNAVSAPIETSAALPGASAAPSFSDYQAPVGETSDAALVNVQQSAPLQQTASNAAPTETAVYGVSESSQQNAPSVQNAQLDLLGFDANAIADPQPEESNTLDVSSFEEPVLRDSFSATPTQAVKSANEEQGAEKPTQNPNEVSLEAAKLSESDLKKLTIEDVRISGLEMTVQQFNKIVKTRIGAKFNQQRLEEDKRALLQTKQFIDVAVSTSWTPEKPDKVIVNFDLTPRRMMRYVKVVGNKKISKHDILEELGIKPGQSRLDPYEVENGRLRIIEFYKSKEYAEPHVEILRGDRPEDIGVVYLIDEGVNQRVLKTTFVGNRVVSAARLRSLVSVKPGILYFIGGKFTRDRLDADVEKLLEYYRQLGYFDARIDREYRESSGFAGLGKDNAWATVRYIIDEGPRYKIRKFTFAGNRVLQTKELESLLKVKPNSYYFFSDVEADRIALRCKYQDLGYVLADITPNLIFTDEVGVVDVRYDIKEDHRYRVRDVIVDYVGTDSRTMTPVVLNMLDLTPGELLNGVKIRQSENTLRQSGYFNDKPSEGQLPEISVVPDDSRVFTPETSNAPDEDVVKEARKADEPVTNDNKSRGSGRDAVTRGQVNDPEFQYTPYEETKKTRDTQTVVFQSYGPSAAASAPNARLNTQRAANASGVSIQATAPQLAISPTRPFSSIVRGQTTIPSGFSSVTTRANTDAAYTPYGSNVSGESQYEVADYANTNSESYPNYNTNGENSAAGFSAGVYDSIGEEVNEPIAPEQDDIYNGDVLIKLKEGRTGMFTASIGVNSDYGLVGNVSFTERNFNLFRPPTNFFTTDGWKDAFRGGGQIFNVQASPGANVQSYRVSWDVPYVFQTKNTFGVTGLYGDHSFDEWFESRYGGEIRLGRQWTPRFGTTLSGGIYQVKISQPQVSFVPDLNSALGRHDEYTLGLSAAYDTRNHPYTPSEGYLVKGTVEEVLGDYQFPRASLSGRYFKTLHKRVDGSGRWILGLYSDIGWNGDNAPIYERYYGGGSTNLRGFTYRGVTPRYAATGFGIGGNFQFFNSAELLIPVSGGDEFQIATFIDSGTVATDIGKWGRYRVAPGFGLRFTIPMLGPAPLALDFAFPISKDPNDETEVFSFNISGSR